MKDNFKGINRVLWLVLFANLTVAALKIIIGNFINSASILADGYHSLTDGSSNIIGLIGVKLASKPVDKCHPYGHRKFETLAGMFIAAMLFIIGLNIVFEGVSRIIHPVFPHVSLESIIILIATILINIIISTYEYKMGKKLKSTILISDSMHTRSDLFISLGVLATIISIKLGLPPILDLITSFLVGAFIFHAAYEVFKYNRDILVDRAVVDDETIRDICLSFNEVKNIYRIRSRGNEENIHIDMHIEMEPTLSVKESHELIHNIEEEMKKSLNKNVQLFAHIEPCDSVDNEQWTIDN